MMNFTIVWLFQILKFNSADLANAFHHGTYLYIINSGEVLRQAMITQGSHVYESHCKSILPKLRSACWFFCNPKVEKLLAWQGVERTTLDLSSQSDALAD